MSAGANKKIPEEDYPLIRELYEVEHLKISELCRKWECSSTAIYTVIRKLGLVRKIPEGLQDLPVIKLEEIRLGKYKLGTNRTALIKSKSNVPYVVMDFRDYLELISKSKPE